MIHKMIQYPYIDAVENDPEDDRRWLKKMIQYSHTEIAEDDLAEIDDEDVWWCSKNSYDI